MTQDEWQFERQFTKHDRLEHLLIVHL